MDCMQYSSYIPVLEDILGPFEVDLCILEKQRSLGFSPKTKFNISLFKESDDQQGMMVGLELHLKNTSAILMFNNSSVGNFQCTLLSRKYQIPFFVYSILL